MFHTRYRSHPKLKQRKQYIQSWRGGVECVCGGQCYYRHAADSKERYCTRTYMHSSNPIIFSPRQLLVKKRSAGLRAPATFQHLEATARPLNDAYDHSQPEIKCRRSHIAQWLSIFFSLFFFFCNHKTKLRNHNEKTKKHLFTLTFFLLNSKTNDNK